MVNIIMYMKKIIYVSFYGTVFMSVIPKICHDV